MLRVQYENMVAEPEKQVRRLLDFVDVELEIELEDACLNFYKADRSIRTPSSEQVRQPIYKSALEQWRNFESFLGPLKAALADEIAAWPA